MKKSIFLLAILGAFTGAVQAQSNVTLFGLLDAGVNYISNDGGKANWTATSGVLSGNRWGLRGVEDLGGGLKAMFQLESGFLLANGVAIPGGLLFGRQAWIALSSGTAGTVTLGRQYDTLVEYVQPVTGVQYSGLAHPFDNDNLDNVFRLANAIKYTSIDYYGFKFGGLYSFSNSPRTGVSPSGFSNNRAWSLGAGYANGPFNLAAGYLHLNNPNFTANGAVSPLYTTVTGAGLAGAVTRENVWAAGGTYAIGRTKVGLVYSHSRFDSLADTLKFDNYEVHAGYQMTPAMLLGARYTFTNSKLDSTGAKRKFHQIELSGDYALSKRTDVYLLGAYQKAAGDATNAVITPDTFGAGGPIGSDASTSKSQALVRLGLRHKF